jgi:hypothetical protein
MTQEDKELLLKDLCARLPYGVKCSFGVDDAIYEICGINPVCCGASEIQATHIKSGINGDFAINACKPYLFPLSSMTEEQKMEIKSLCDGTEIFDDGGWMSYISIVGSFNFELNLSVVDWLNKNHFDYIGLIPKGLAIDATGLNIY